VENTLKRFVGWTGHTHNESAVYPRLRLIRCWAVCAEMPDTRSCCTRWICRTVF